MPETYLQTAYKDRERVKGLGARWDPARKQWYVPEGRDLAPFVTWLPAEHQTGLSTREGSASTELTLPTQGISLSQLLAGVAQAVAQAYRAGEWVRVEVVKADARRGHVYLELTERSPAGDSLAQARAMIWAETANQIVPEFERATGVILGAGIKLLLRAKPTLAQYQALVAHLPRPSAQQMHDFAVFIGNAHSWYKHLPLLPPGRPLSLFLDPAAGMQLTIGADGRTEATVRERRGFHYSWLPTHEHRERFGYLAFARHDGTRVSLATAVGTRDVGSDDFPCVFDGTTQSLRPLPAEVLHAGRARISGLAHTLGAAYSPLLECLEENPGVVWPEESGGQAQLAQILARCRDLRQGVAQAVTMSIDDPRLVKDYHRFQVDTMLYDLLEPERRRQRNGLVAAMKQMLRLLEAA